MNRTTLTTSKSPYINSFFTAESHPNKSLNVIIIFKLPSALRTNRLIVANHVLFLPKVIRNISNVGVDIPTLRII